MTEYILVKDVSILRYILYMSMVWYNFFLTSYGSDGNMNIHMQLYTVGSIREQFSLSQFPFGEGLRQGVTILLVCM